MNHRCTHAIDLLSRVGAHAFAVGPTGMLYPTTALLDSVGGELTLTRASSDLLQHFRRSGRTGATDIAIADRIGDASGGRTGVRVAACDDSAFVLLTTDPVVVGPLGTAGSEALAQVPRSMHTRPGGRRLRVVR